MPSHLSSLGFNIKNTQEFIELFKKAYEQGELIESKNGSYVKWSIDGMVELYGQIDNEGSPIGLNPHFKGLSRQEIKLTELIKNGNDTVLDGRFSCWANPNEETDGDFPFVFDCPNVDLYNDLELPKNVEAQIMGIAHYIELHDSDEAFLKSQNKEPKYACESFIPCGMFNTDFSQKSEVDSMAILSGHIKEVKKMINTHTNLGYTYIIVEVLGCSFDIIVDNTLVTKEPVIGGVVSGTFWLSGTVLGINN